MATRFINFTLSLPQCVGCDRLAVHPDYPHCCRNCRDGRINGNANHTHDCNGRESFLLWVRSNHEVQIWRRWNSNDRREWCCDVGQRLLCHVAFRQYVCAMVKKLCCTFSCLFSRCCRFTLINSLFYVSHGDNFIVYSQTSSWDHTFWKSNAIKAMTKKAMKAERNAKDVSS